MEKINKQTLDLTSENISKIAELFPNVITEKEDENGKIIKAVDFDLLRQELSKDLIEGADERYRLDWPGKRRSILKANTPINKTLIPDRDSSVNFDTTGNVYIEGDNFEVLKILQESYLGKIKMIYIDPPYNTGKDFVYKDNFKVSKDEYEAELGTEDGEGGRLFKNTDTNGRFHSDWLSMMYERLMIARDLLTDDGVIFMSIDDNEVHNLRKIADEIFGEVDFISQFIWNKKNVVQNDADFVSVNHEYILCYAKDADKLNFNLTPRNEEQLARYKNPDNDIRGPWTSVALQAKSGSSTYEITFDNGVTWKPTEGTYPRLSKSSLLKAYEENRLWFGENSKNVPRLKKYLSEVQDGVISNTLLLADDVGSTQLAKETLKRLIDSNIFDTPKPIGLIERFLNLATLKFDEDIILDFFSGSSTTAHAVMQINAEDGGNRKFIMVQLPENTDENSEAYKTGYKTISEIGRERIRRAGKKILEENADKLKERENPLDIGFRSYKITDSIMEDVYKNPSELKQGELLGLADNIKADKKPEDILTSVILNLGLTLDLPIKEEKIGNNTIFNVAEGSLVACLDKDIDFSIIDEIAKMKPLKVVFRDASFKDDKDRINLETKFKQLSPDTNIKVL